MDGNIIRGGALIGGVGTTNHLTGEILYLL